MTLLALFLFLTGARAQQALPYEYSFENNNLTTDGWTIQGRTSNYTGLFSNSSGLGDYAHTGSYFFLFNYSEQNAYLISPLLTGGENGVDVSFWYTEYDNSYGDEQFQVGYTTDETVTDASLFTYGDAVTASMNWQQYSNTVPAGTKRIAIKYIYNDTYYFILDDFVFDAHSDFEKPTALTVTDLTTNSANISWTAPATKCSGYAYQYKKATEADWSAETTVNATSISLSGLSSGTPYNFRVKATYKEGESGFATINFTTDCSSYAIPYTYGFEDEGDMTCWTVMGISLRKMDTKEQVAVVSCSTTHKLLHNISFRLCLVVS